MFRFPWGDMHSLNLGWFLQKFNELREDWATAEAGIDGALDAEIEKAEDALSDVFDARDAAAASATAAAGSASSAGTSATAAQNSATAAASSATLANNKATAAGLSEAAAAQSATQAGNSATAAAGSATTASQSATNAAASETAAGNSATAAAGSATAAGNSATAAAASAAAAEAVEESIPADYTTLSNNVSQLSSDVSQLDEEVFYFDSGEKNLIWVLGLVANGQNFQSKPSDKVTRPILLKATETVKVKTKGDGSYWFNCISKVDSPDITVASGYPCGTVVQAITTNALTTYTHTATEDEYLVFCVLDDPSSEVTFENLISSEISIVLHNNLSMQKLGVNGDSICYGVGYPGGYGSIIAENNDMRFQNIAISGSTIAYIAGHGCISRTINNLSTDCDFILIEGGVNDGALGVPLGALTTGYNAALDDTTFYGAMETICKQLTTRFAGKKYGFIIPHQMSSYMNPPNGAFYKAVYDCCIKWGVPILDLAINVPPFAAFGSSGNNNLIAVCDTYTADPENTGHGDGWHPNEAGYKKYYVPKITEWMRGL